MTNPALCSDAWSIRKLGVNDSKDTTAPPDDSNMDDPIKEKKNFYCQFQGDFTPPVEYSSLKETKTEHVSSCDLQSDRHSQIRCRVREWIGFLPRNVQIEKLELIFNPIRYRLFLNQLQTVECRQEKSAFQPNLSIENDQEERINVLKRLQAQFPSVAHNRKARIVRMWHGCSRKTLSDLLSDGIATLGTKDDGWYGKAMYFTSSAEYALRYSGDDGCLILCYILILNPFPIVYSDCPSNMEPAKFRFYGKGNYKNYQCHYVPIDQNDFRPPLMSKDAKFDELAVFQEANILPQIVVYLKSG
ncbi:unnamed protein product [Didymodactylos carnosus]|uniref:PARP catalytic domain-containing protein n=1 Tax=Didymodactylos carnosus TaxID=1234261 RepID=A0A816AYA6_9BILA|nr:unnamed protein product [Didymodactylos carnosus]CAF4481655.1 unnamed protein product [Didymodactylos carnosus]